MTETQTLIDAQPQLNPHDLDEEMAEFGFYRYTVTYGVRGVAGRNRTNPVPGVTFSNPRHFDFFDVMEDGRNQAGGDFVGGSCVVITMNIPPTETEAAQEVMARFDTDQVAVMIDVLTDALKVARASE